MIGIVLLVLGEALAEEFGAFLSARPQLDHAFTALIVLYLMWLVVETFVLSLFSAKRVTRAKQPCEEPRAQVPRPR
ncbi:MAG: hypothetical protein ABW252_15170 [Polyangiales bacterium]